MQQLGVVGGEHSRARASVSALFGLVQSLLIGPATRTVVLKASDTPNQRIRPRRQYPQQRDRVVEEAAMAREMFRL